ncbi:MAG TPA: glycoside hydrolase family 2 TIM barrel-domain containing protein, partial [Ignavibacteriaceae bacterium]|nr:glycoside hydrolase family 2 TIM barrel-domain containing protein [Ignavibacteriaceae bacterium]
MLRPKLNKYRHLIDQSGIWKFKIDPDNTGEKSGWNNNFESELDIAVPGSWNEQLQEEGLLNYIGKAWYSREIFIPDEFKERRIWLWIGSADYYAKVWINGKLIGEHTGGFLPVNFEITEFVSTGSINSLAIKIDNRLTKDTIPQGIEKQNYIDEKRMREETFPAARFDFFPFGGIHRPVILYTTFKNFISDVTVVTKVGEKSCSLKIDVDTDSEDEGFITLVLNGNNERKEFSSVVRNNKAILTFELNKYRLWSTADPYLYDLIIELKIKEKVVDHYSLKIGLREIKINGYKLLLNNKPVFLKGFGKHEDFPITGKALNLPLLVKDFSLLKWINANSFRTSHYPYAEEILDLADKKGILVINEVAAVSLDFRHTTPKTLLNHKNAVKELINRDKNHPSVIAWALGNEPNLAGEEEYLNGSGKKYWKEVFEYAKSIDSTRPFTVPNCPRAGNDDPVYALSDFISINRYYGWYENPGQIELGCKRMEDELDYLAKKYKKPIMVSEFGVDTLPGLHSTEPTMFTEEYQSEFIQA